jgi:hypothetical protein
MYRHRFALLTTVVVLVIVAGNRDNFSFFSLVLRDPVRFAIAGTRSR